MEPKKMQHLLIKLAAAAIVAVAFGSGQAQAGPLPALNDLANQTSQATPVEKAGNYRYRYGGSGPTGPTRTGIIGRAITVTATGRIIGDTAIGIAPITGTGGSKTRQGRELLAVLTSACLRPK